VYPALAVAERLLEADPQTQVAFVGTVGGFEKPLVEKSGVRLDSLDEVQAGAMHGVGVLKAIQGVLKSLTGTVQAFGILGRRKPQVVLMTGGWVGLPVALAAWLRRIPVAIFLPDIEPALSIKVLRPFAAKIAVTTSGSAPYVPASKMVVTGYPLRRTLTHMPAPDSLGEEQLATGDYPSFVAIGKTEGTALHVPVTRAAGISHFKLDPSKKTLLVFGGSRGARSINIAVIDALPELLGRGDLQIIHVTGDLDAERGQAVTADGYHPYAYLHDDMGLAMAAADLCICRSGASTLGELPYFGLPSILVPYPFAWRYQKVNADYLAARGAALVLPDEQMPERLADTVRILLDDSAKLAAMRDAARALDRPHAALAIGEMLKSIAKGSHTV
jgi:UDP-N-acetylglucosamine--N-acetylmuramyl-(pentapeptide) pyrophosphoryl-undecaprenol N-acetylglucosamine transferase